MARPPRGAARGAPRLARWSDRSSGDRSSTRTASSSTRESDDAAAAARRPGRHRARGRAPLPRVPRARSRRSAREPVQVTLSARYAWQLRLANGIVLELGRDQARQSLEERLARFVAAYPRAAAHLDQRIGYVDLRYPNGFAMRVPEATARGRPVAQANLSDEVPMKKQLSFVGPISAGHGRASLRHRYAARGRSRRRRARRTAPAPAATQRNLIVGLDIGTSKVVARRRRAAARRPARGDRHGQPRVAAA